MLRIEFLELLHCDLTVTVLLHPWSLELEVYNKLHLHAILVIGTTIIGKYSSHVTCIITVLLLLSAWSATNMLLRAASNTIWVETHKDAKSWKVFHHWFSTPANISTYARHHTNIYWIWIHHPSQVWSQLVQSLHRFPPLKGSWCVLTTLCNQHQASSLQPTSTCCSI